LVKANNGNASKDFYYLVVSARKQQSTIPSGYSTCVLPLKGGLVEASL